MTWLLFTLAIGILLYGELMERTKVKDIKPKGKPSELEKFKLYYERQEDE